MAIRIYDDYISLEVNGRVVATTRYSQYAAADGSGAWIVSWCTKHLFSRDEAITALTTAELRAIGRADGDLYNAGHSQRSTARDLNIGRRKVKQIIDCEAA
jgi:hypothetical protein